MSATSLIACFSFDQRVCDSAKNSHLECGWHVVGTNQAGIKEVITIMVLIIIKILTTTIFIIIVTSITIIIQPPREDDVV